MAQSEWMRSFWAVRDTPVADYSVAAINTTHRVAYRPLIAVLSFLLVLSVFYFKQLLWCCGQLWRYFGMGSYGTRLNRDCYMMCCAAKISPCIPSTCMQNAILSLLIIHTIWSRKIYAAIDNPLLVPSVSFLTTSSYLCNYVRPADNVSHTEYLQRNGCQWFSHLYKFRDPM